MTAEHFSVSGRVQGVGFRYFVQSTAGRLGLSGWVRNLPDGSVEGVAAGDPETLQRFAQALRKGPAMSRVDSVHTAPYSGQVGSGFEILR